MTKSLILECDKLSKDGENLYSEIRIQTLEYLKKYPECDLRDMLFIMNSGVSGEGASIRLDNYFKAKDKKQN